MKEQDFIQKICGYAISDMKENGILASVTIAQAILESSWGTSELAKKANNYFGMKCSLSSNSWGSVWDRVSKYTKVTNEQDEAGKIYTIKADFRAYPDIEMSIKDHSMYLVGAMNGTEHRYCGIANEKDYRSRIKVCIREFREFIIVMPNLNYDIPQDFEENEIRSEFARTRMQIISIQIKK